MSLETIRSCFNLATVVARRRDFSSGRRELLLWLDQVSACRVLMLAIEEVVLSHGHPFSLLLILTSSHWYWPAWRGSRWGIEQGLSGWVRVLIWSRRQLLFVNDSHVVCCVDLFLQVALVVLYLHKWGRPSCDLLMIVMIVLLLGIWVEYHRCAFLLFV